MKRPSNIFSILRIFDDEFNYHGISSNIFPIFAEDGSAGKLSVTVDKKQVIKSRKILEGVVERVSLDFSDKLENVEEVDYKENLKDAEVTYLFTFK